MSRLSEISSVKLDDGEVLTVIVFGATGDLAKRKIFPALYQLIYECPDAPLLPVTTRIVGYGRSAMKLNDFIAKQCVYIEGSHRDDFLQQISYCQGGYDKEDDFAKLHNTLLDLEGGARSGNRLFFLSVPPTVFGCVCQNIHLQARAVGGFTRVIIEKPFGRDSRTFAELNATTSSFFREDQIYRIDHYLAKEKVLNLLAFRFGNQIYEPLWDRHHIAQVEIVFKENIGTEGRGGYFDEFGIIRDIMQNHLLQVLLWLTMEPPAQLDAEHVAMEKCRLLRTVRTLGMEDCFLGQFGAGTREENGAVYQEPGYLEDSTVPSGSRCPTFAAVVLRVDNERWQGVPFLMRAGKGLNERLAEVRITFKRQFYNSLVPGEPNQLVLQIQPEAEIFFKCINKRPGWKQDNTAPVHLDMNYKRAFPGSYQALAYERMLLNAARGDQSLFVGSEELVEAWRIFTPLLDEIDEKRPQPVCYPFGVRVPDGFDKFASERGIACEDASGHYYLPKFIRGIEVLVPEGDNVWRADNSRLGSHNGGLAYRSSAVFEDVLGHDQYLTYGERTQGIEVGNNFVKCNVHALPGVPDPHCVSTPTRRGRDENSPMSGPKMDKPTKRSLGYPQDLPSLPRKNDEMKPKADARDATPPRRWRSLKPHDSF